MKAFKTEKRQWQQTRKQLKEFLIDIDQKSQFFIEHHKFLSNYEWSKMLTVNSLANKALQYFNEAQKSTAKEVKKNG